MKYANDRERRRAAHIELAACCCMIPVIGLVSFVVNVQPTTIQLAKVWQCAIAEYRSIPSKSLNRILTYNSIFLLSLFNDFIAFLHF